MQHLAGLFFATLALTGCLNAWEVGGPWRCSSGNSCPATFSCDEGLCCKPGGLPACPTLPAPNGSCPEGGEATAYFQDADGDGDGNQHVVTLRCNPPASGGWVLTGTDCDDTNPAIHPGGAELCNGKDDNCEGHLDEGLSPQSTFFLDVDGDGFGQDERVVRACAAPSGYVKAGGDCAPFDPTKFPAAPESCNGLDDNCNGLADALEPTFADVDSPAHPFPCLSSGQGQCQAGVFSCQPQADGGVQRTCQPLATPTREVCDGLDNDCDGLIDEAPDCGGPTQLINLPGATYSAGKLLSSATLATQCQKGVSATLETATAQGRWAGGGTGYHLWSVEAPANQVWDLSNPNALLRLAFLAQASGGAAPRGPWGDPTLGDAINPVIYLCGDDVSQVMRYRLASSSTGFRGSDTEFDRTLQLKGVGSDWLIGQGSGFDTTRVTRLELVVFSYATTFTLTFSPDAGFSR
jgi:hypothetical protein